MADYESASSRHFKDALMLKEAGSLDNAGHLIGFAAECAIKLRIENFNPLANVPFLHFPDLIDVAKRRLSGRSQYTSMFDLLKSPRMVGWLIERRYNRTGETSTGELDVWFGDAKRIMAAASVRATG